MTCPRVGHINFLNVLPLTWSYAHGADQGLAITRGVPAVLNNDIVNHRLDVSNVSSIIYARDSEELVVLPDVCVSSDGDVQSILLVSRKPIGDLRDDKIILTAKSATSHCLLKIIRFPRMQPHRC
jgi:chorismate dehydratase